MWVWLLLASSVSCALGWVLGRATCRATHLPEPWATHDQQGRVTTDVMRAMLTPPTFDELDTRTRMRKILDGEGEMLT